MSAELEVSSTISDSCHLPPQEERLLEGNLPKKMRESPMLCSPHCIAPTWTSLTATAYVLHGPVTSHGVRWISRFAVLSASRLDFAKMTLEASVLSRAPLSSVCWLMMGNAGCDLTRLHRLQSQDALPTIDPQLLQETFDQSDIGQKGFAPHAAARMHLQMLHR